MNISLKIATIKYFASLLFYVYDELYNSSFTLSDIHQMNSKNLNKIFFFLLTSIIFN